MHPKEIVRAEYNKFASSYEAARRSDSKDIQLLNLLIERLPRGAMVLDAGCGSGYPVAQFLAKVFQVIGLDFAWGSLRLAKKKAPDTGLICGDISNLPFPNGTFDAVCSYYAIIHVPRSEHPKLLLDFHRILRPDGLALLCLGAGDLPGDISDYHGTRMFWSHYDSQTNLKLMKESGFGILRSEIIEDSTDPASSHLFLLGRKE